MVTQKLPPICATRLNTDNSPILIKRGESGYYIMPESCGTPEDFNRKMGITKAQVKAMEVGSMFGWDVPGADPDKYNENGYPVV